MAAQSPGQRAVVVPAGRDAAGRRAYVHLTFAQLEVLASAYAHGLEKQGIGRGVRTVLMVTPGLDFVALVFALFKVGAVTVLVDPGIGRKSLLTCLEESEPEAFVGVTMAQAARALFRHRFPKVRALVTVGPRLFWGGATLEALREDARPYPACSPAADETAAILFTSGGTGIPKGAVYTHGMFAAQVEAIRAAYDIRPGESELATFPLFALFDPALGMTAVLPEMDFRKPAQADPRLLVEAIVDQGVTSMFGSPALLDRLSRYGEEQQLKLPMLRRVLSSGAPVRLDILRRMQAMLENGAQVHPSFGATESMPVATIGSHEVLASTHLLTAQGKGICVGRVVPSITLRLIRVTDEPIAQWSDDLLVPAGEPGEICVRGPVVSASYYARPIQTAAAKLREKDQIVHRMGDIGWMDDEGRLWMLGRKTDRVMTADGVLYTVSCEAIFNQHAAVRRSALVGVGLPGAHRPVLVVERNAGQGVDEAKLSEELLALGAQHALTKSIRTVLLHPGTLPVDIRHNAKINRQALARWAAERVS
jgi:acyl-CoA synthetase (AMP-forming)/AMP-acid ligase II